MKHGFCDACFSGEYILLPGGSEPPDRQMGLFPNSED